MVNQKWVAIAYCCSFLFIYLCFIAYSLIPLLMSNLGIEVQSKLPQNSVTIAYNSTIANTGVMSLNDFGSWTLIISITIAIIIGLIIIRRSMGVAYA